MQILNLKLLNFRNYSKLELDFSPSKNIIIGKNGMGKTNIVEAIYVLALTKSFRGSDNTLVKSNEDTMRITADIKSSFIDNYKLVLSKDDKRVSINKNRVKRLSDYVSNINVVLFSVDDLRLIKDTPSTRRKMINIELSQLNNEYLNLVNTYNKLIKQRNSYLKTLLFNNYASREYLQIMTEKVIEIGLKIYEYRKNFFDNINPLVSKIYESITGCKDIKIEYISDFKNDIKKIRERYKHYEEKDINFSKTHFGVHHDDFIFIKDGVVLRDFGSEGEQKNAIIALKLAELEYFSKVKGDKPILILDDLFSELDSEKINNILRFIPDDIQTFITTTELNKVKKSLVNKSKIFKVINGRVEE